MTAPRLALALTLALAGAGGAAALGAPPEGSAGDGGRMSVVVRAAGGDVLARVPLEGGRFAVSYRNSLYGTLAEERYAVAPDGRFALVELAADQLAVLEEYYAVPGAPRRAPDGDRRALVADPHPDRAAVFGNLSIAATDLGKRTLLVPGSPPVELWRLVDADPTIVLHLEEVP
ncbi:MAG: hypothetical protein M3P96_10880 [Actinomycetota bacterium]|nr:hypothetical protein [Actinomycetota bacterium]